ncbi:SDR family NAD(P)-dependent oxidoreductase [Chondromyces apiculatus]|uniref:3-oxoacyl-[acyl-carrier protein] reductase n=1 Tax=Chondromyces apiculatus DSM 436 TaxID=1192034 RepID=A0A017THQ6_9BACT|nr:SDR family NAD(P)-dependent oxidoreductase [Chondromyces apiculatus]EYF08116.1 3-oxoacyl-[acyl-carrier protein] reductase [Chondromyces apiculatus DSM 436]
MSKVWFITGANRGLGAAIGRAALEAGHSVVATARNPSGIAEMLGDKGGRVLPVALDVTDAKAVEAAVARAVDAFGHIDVLVNNAGYGHLGAFEETSPEDMERQFATNVFGLMKVTRTVLPLMRGRRQGHIFNISSMMGYKGAAFSSLYSASKFAVAGFSESLAEELAGFGIRVTLVEPGAFRTDFIDAVPRHDETLAIDDYAAARAAFTVVLQGLNHQQVGDPVKLGKALLVLAEAEAPTSRFPVGADAIAWMEAKDAIVQADVARWRDLALDTALEP